MGILRKSLLTALLLICSTTALSQEPQRAADRQNLTLFEAVETSANRANSPNRENRPSSASRVTPAEPEFTLIGTSKIGGEQSVMVRHRSGEVVRLKVNSTGNTPIGDFNGYSLVNVASGTVSISYPANNPCMEFTDKGVRCSGAGNIANLVLAAGEPLPPSIAVTSPAAELAAEVVVESTDTDPVNPFEALRNGRDATSRQDGNEEARRFTPRRINPEDVPEGMRVIATPFGDRLVEQ
jgi:hypothetical protein